MDYMRVSHSNLQRNIPSSSATNAPSSSSSSSASSFGDWKKFFVSAGIPSSVAGKYADTFADHRIQMDMLKEITKDILIDMGIKAMGDIIAILRQAKTVYTKDELKVNSRLIHSADSDVQSRNLVPSNSAPFSIPSIPQQQQQQQQQHHLHLQNTKNTSRMQSQVSLTSGAVINSQPATLPSLVSSSKRHISSNLSPALSKRLRPAPDTQEHYNLARSSTFDAPIQHADHSIHHKLSASSVYLSHDHASSIKSRLSGKINDPSTDIVYKTNGESTKYANDLRRLSVNSNHVSARPSSHIAPIRHTIYKKPVKDRLGRTEKAFLSTEKKHPSTRLKSTVFSRLGEGGTSSASSSSARTKR